MPEPDLTTLLKTDKDNLSVDDFSKFIKEAGLEGTLKKYLQSHVDRKVSEIQDGKFKTLTDEMTQLRTLLANDGRERLVKDALKKSEIHEGFEKFVEGDTPEAIEKSVAALKEQIIASDQEKIDDKLQNLDVPKSGLPTSDSPLMDYVETKNKERSIKPTKGFPQTEEKDG